MDQSNTQPELKPEVLSIWLGSDHIWLKDPTRAILLEID